MQRPGKAPLHLFLACLYPWAQQVWKMSSLGKRGCGGCVGGSCHPNPHDPEVPQGLFLAEQQPQRSGPGTRSHFTLGVGCLGFQCFVWCCSR